MLLGFGLFLTTVKIAADDSMDFQKSLPALVVWGVPGKDVELPCDVTPEGDDRVSMILWFKDTVGIPLYSLDARGGPLEQATHWAISNDLGGRSNFLTGKGSAPARLKINSVVPADEGIFRCRIDYYNSPTKNYNVNLTLVVQSSEPIIYDAQGREVIGAAGPFLEGYDLFLSCHVVGGRPRPKVTWWRGGEILDDEMESITPTLVVNQYFRPNVSRSLYNTTVKCIAITMDIAPPLEKEIRIEVYLKPKKVKITTLSEVLSAGRPQQHQCDTWGSIPPAKITWLLEGEAIRTAAISTTHGVNLTTSILTYRPDAEDDGKELTCRAENPRYPGSILEENTLLTVLYPPVVTVKVATGMNTYLLKEGDQIHFVCKIRSNPDPTVVSWFHGQRFVFNNDSLGIAVTGKGLELQNLTREQSGGYSCGARNSVGEARSEPIIIRVQFAPKCKPGTESRMLGALKRDTLTIRCDVIADPWTDVRFSWTFNQSKDVDPVPASKINSTGLFSSVEFTPITNADFGTFACWASNSVGRQIEPCMTHVFPAKTPQAPKDCRIQNHTFSGYEIICQSGQDGGLQQHFMLEVYESGTVSNEVGGNDKTEFLDREGLLRFKMLEAQPTFHLRELESGKSYRLLVFAVNAKGRSDPPVVIPELKIESTSAHRLTSTEIADKGNNEEDNPMVIILAILVTVALLIVAGIATAAGLVLCKKRSTSVNQLRNDYENVLQEAQKVLQKNEEAFIVKIPASRENYKPKKMNNVVVRKSIHEVLPIDVDVTALKNVHDILPPVVEGSNVVIRRNQTNPTNPSRKSLTFVNNESNGEYRKSNLRNSGVEEKTVARRTSVCEESGKRSHPRVTLNPDGEVLRCVMTEGPEVRKDIATSKTVL